MPIPQQAIIGLSPGMRTLGVAIIKRGELLYWSTKTHKYRYNEKKTKKIVAQVQVLLKRYQVKHLAIKHIHPNRCSPELQELTNEVISLCQQMRVTVSIYDIENIKRLLPIEANNKASLINWVSHRYPEIAYLRVARHEKPTHYHYKVFEAVAAAHLAIAT